MNIKNRELEFDVLGFKVRFRPEGDEDQFTAGDIINLVNTEAKRILDKNPKLTPSQAAILVALNLAKEKLNTDIEFRNNIDTLHSTASDALQFIEELTPPSTP